MKNRPLIHIGTEDGNRLGLDSGLFSSGMAYDLRPKTFAIVNLHASAPKDTAYEHLLAKLALTATPTEIVAPDAELINKALSQGWKLVKKPEGTVIIHNQATKKTWLLKDKQ